jgi:hypothetical protein
MNEEIEAIESNNTWYPIHIPTGKTNIGFKGVYKTKFNEKGKVEKKGKTCSKRVYSTTRY